MKMKPIMTILLVLTLVTIASAGMNYWEYCVIQCNETRAECERDCTIDICINDCDLVENMTEEECKNNCETNPPLSPIEKCMDEYCPDSMDCRDACHCSLGCDTWPLEPCYRECGLSPIGTCLEMYCPDTLDCEQGCKCVLDCDWGTLEECAQECDIIKPTPPVEPPRPIPKPGQPADNTLLYIVGLLVVVAAIAVLYLKRK